MLRVTGVAYSDVTGRSGDDLDISTDGNQVAYSDVTGRSGDDLDLSTDGNQVASSDGTGATIFIKVNFLTLWFKNSSLVVGKHMPLKDE